MSYPDEQYDPRHSPQQPLYPVYAPAPTPPALAYGQSSEFSQDQLDHLNGQLLTQDQLNYPPESIPYIGQDYVQQDAYAPVPSGSIYPSSVSFAQQQPAQWWSPAQQQWTEATYAQQSPYDYQTQRDYVHTPSTAFTSPDPAFARLHQEATAAQVKFAFHPLPASDAGRDQPQLSRNASQSTIYSGTERSLGPSHTTAAPRRRAPPSPSPPPPSLVSKLQAIAAARRATLRHSSGLPRVNPPRESADNSPTLSATSSPGPSRLNSTKPRTTLELSLSCNSCAQRGVKLVLRGEAIKHHEFRPQATFVCATCLAANEDDNVSSSTTATDQARRSFPTYDQTLSAAVDRAQGLTVSHPIHEEDLSSGKLPRLAGGWDRFKCDCCMKNVGAGLVFDPLGGPSRPTGSFTIETVCTRCQVRYKCCSDCGGGGGRLTIGRWRCAELFPMGRKTCRLSHARQPKMDKLEWSVRAISDIPEEEFGSMMEGCRTLYFNSRLQTVARPEILEHGVAQCATFEQAERLTIDSWNVLEPFFSQDVESTRSIRRYLTLQTSKPAGHKSKPKSRAPAGEAEDGALISGFMLVDWDMRIGAVHIVCQMPWERTGDAYDAVTRCGTECTSRIRADLQRENAKRAARGEELLPGLKCAWFLSPFSKGSRSYVNVRGRGYVSLAELREDAKWAQFEDEARPLGGAFPPDRETHIPAKYIGSYQICVRAFDDEHDLGGPPLIKKRPRKPKKGSPSPAVPPSRRR